MCQIISCHLYKGFMNLFSEYWYQVKSFKRNNNILFCCFIASIIVCISYILSMHQKELFDGAGDWFNLLFQLAVGFIINFMFYITQVYIPRYKQNIEVNRCISARISNIVSNMRSLFQELGKIYTDGYDEDCVTDEYFFALLKKFNGDDRTQVLNSAKVNFGKISAETHFTVREWVISRVDFVEKESDKIFQYYAQYITPELMKTLESILRSPMHRNMARSFLVMPRCPSFKEMNQDIFMKPYYDQMKKLENIKSEYDYR